MKIAMKTHRTIPQRFAALAAPFIMLPGIIPADAQDRLEWWQIDRQIGRKLIFGEKNLVQWAGEVAASEPENAEDALMKLNVCMRAALDDEACDAVRVLWQLGPEKIDSYQITSAYYAATDWLQAWDVALAIVENFAPRIHEIELSGRLFQHFRAADHPQRWSDDDLIAWLDARIESVRRYDAENKAREAEGHAPPAMMPDLWRVRPIHHWTRLRLIHLASMGRAREELDRMAVLVRAHPTDVGIASDYLMALKELRTHPRKPETGSLKWMADICRPALATDMARLASLLAGLEEYKLAEIYYLRTLDTDLTDEELPRLTMMTSVFLPQETHRLLFGVRIREELAKCLLQLGETGRSQELMVEAADIREKHKLPPNPYLAGMVQRESGARVIEGRIREEEETGKDEPEYWLKRADYYRGRSEAAEEENALRHGLALSPPAPQPLGKAPREMRARILSNLARMLIREERPGEAVNLLVAELKEVPVDAASSESAARLLAFDLRKFIDPDEPALWNWLARRDRWESTEERLLLCVLENTPLDARDPHFSRAEDLAMADGADPSRAATLGWILNRMGQEARSIPLLSHAVETAGSDPLRHRAAFTLFESYLGLKDWRSAESRFPMAQKRLTSKEAPEWLGRVAVIAAEKGSPEDAMRIFRNAANCNLRPGRLVADLSNHGLRDELRHFYDEVRAKLPSAKLDGFPER